MYQMAVVRKESKVIKTGFQRIEKSKNPLWTNLASYNIV